jgi:hypothetical protein
MTISDVYKYLILMQSKIVTNDEILRIIEEKLRGDVRDKVSSSIEILKEK